MTAARTGHTSHNKHLNKRRAIPQKPQREDGFPALGWWNANSAHSLDDLSGAIQGRRKNRRNSYFLNVTIDCKDFCFKNSLCPLFTSVLVWTAFAHLAGFGRDSRLPLIQQQGRLQNVSYLQHVLPAVFIDEEQFLSLPAFSRVR